MLAYKGFKKDLTCRYHQYEIGVEYIEETAEICRQGFHACEKPFDTFKYYGPGVSRYCLVDLEANEQRGTDSKRVGRRIKILKEIGLEGLIKAEVEMLEKEARTDKHVNIKSKDGGVVISREHDGKGVNRGDNGGVCMTGYEAEGIATGHRGGVVSTGESGKSVSTSERGVSVITGDSGVSIALGVRSVSESTGDYSVSVDGGERGVAASTGDYGEVRNSGANGVALCTGDCGDSASEGKGGLAINTGWHSDAVSEGESSVALSTGECSSASVNGEQSVSIALGVNGKARGGLGCHLVLAEWKEVGEERHEIVCVKCARVDGEKIKPGRYYALIKEDFVEVE